jgi:cytoskeletal protein RodZ
MEETKKEEEVKEEKEVKEVKEEKKEEKGKAAKGNKGLIILIIIAVILVGLFLAGKFLARKVGQGIFSRVLSQVTDTNVKVEGDGDSVTFESDEGEVSFNASGEMPESFPKDFPVYSGATLKSSFTATGEDTKGTSVVWETGDSVDKVTDFYKSELVKKGWKVVSTFEQEGTTTLTFEKEGVGGFLGIAEGEGGKTAISATVGVEE